MSQTVCRYCGEGNSTGAIFCRSCLRSQEDGDVKTLFSAAGGAFSLALLFCLASLGLTYGKPSSQERRLELVQPRYSRLVVAENATSEPEWVEVSKETLVFDSRSRRIPAHKAWQSLVAVAGRRVRLKADWNVSPVKAVEIYLPEVAGVNPPPAPRDAPPGSPP